MYCLLTLEAAHFLGGIKMQIAKAYLSSFTLLFMFKVALYEKLHISTKSSKHGPVAFSEMEI